MKHLKKYNKFNESIDFKIKMAEMILDMMISLTGTFEGMIKSEDVLNTIKEKGYSSIEEYFLKEQGKDLDKELSEIEEQFSEFDNYEVEGQHDLIFSKIELFKSKMKDIKDYISEVNQNLKS